LKTKGENDLDYLIGLKYLVFIFVKLKHKISNKAGVAAIFGPRCRTIVSCGNNFKKKQKTKIHFI
jgi:hypothetical protein